MKIKNFIAADINQAMQQVRSELGADAVIISNRTVNGKVHLTAATDEDFDFDFDAREQLSTLDTGAYFNDSRIREALDYHGVLDLVRGRILSACRDCGSRRSNQDSVAVLEQALRELYRFSPLLDTSNPLKMFMGTPGAGKSTAIAKMATQAKLKNIPVVIVSTDNVRAGANKQLEAFAEILEVEFVFIKEPRRLFDFASQNAGKYGLILIDTPGVNPFVSQEMEKAAVFADAVKADKVLVFDAGRNVYEAVEVAEIFAELGARFLLPTRLDLTRRIGAVLSAANCCGLSFFAGSVGASIANGLAPVDSRSLAQLILS